MLFINSKKSSHDSGDAGARGFLRFCREEFNHDPLSDIGRTVFELDAIRLAAGQKFNRILVDESVTSLKSKTSGRPPRAHVFGDHWFEPF
jgi:hypothetical protein